MIAHSPFTAAEADALLAKQQAFYNSGATRPWAFRIGQLGALRAMVQRYEAEIIAALKADLGKSPFEAYGSEIGVLLAEITHTQRHLRRWMRPRRRPTPLSLFPSRSQVLAQPRGVTLIMAPWNYPLMLVLAPLVSAIAAGNTAILKPSELAPATEALLVKMIGETFDPDYISVVTGPGQELTEQLIARHQLGLVFFTGSTRVGRLVMQAAARQLTPVVLELGGKSPAIVAEDADLAHAAKKIVFSKLLNAGQTCVAPDYLLVHTSIKDRLVALLKQELERQYGPDPQQSPDLGRIINEQRYQILASYLKQGRLLHGGQHDAASRYIAPTLLDEVDPASPLMQEEIFGPVLPILTYQTLDEAKALVERHPNPLALYVYTRSRATERYLLEQLSFGGGCVNNGLVHLANPHLPFNGVGNSGMGMYHGYEGFRTFSHLKSVLKTPTWADLPVWYAPHQPWHLKVMKWFLR
jgi:aldehyde dehydrogenase (NAD+)